VVQFRNVHYRFDDEAMLFPTPNQRELEKTFERTVVAKRAPAIGTGCAAAQISPDKSACIYKSVARALVGPR